MKLAAFVGRTLLFLASMALITGISLFVVGGWLVTWPILRLSPRGARTKALVDIAVAVMALGRAYGLDRKVVEEAVQAPQREDESLDDFLQVP